VPNFVDPARLRSAPAVSYGLYQLTMVLGPDAWTPHAPADPAGTGEQPAPEPAIT
jgi:hypothetical protein